ncbi:hypothetical protein EON64_16065 [archaeon]|nr:MAG: hypothetical protein EON64_16065 [archaeon]
MYLRNSLCREDFADHAMVYNPRGGTAVLPKIITETAKSHLKEGVSSKNLLTGRPMGTRTPPLRSPGSPTNRSPH